MRYTRCQRHDSFSLQTPLSSSSGRMLRCRRTTVKRLSNICLDDITPDKPRSSNAPSGPAIVNAPS